MTHGCHRLSLNSIVCLPETLTSGWGISVPTPGSRAPTFPLTSMRSGPSDSWWVPCRLSQRAALCYYNMTLHARTEKNEKSSYCFIRGKIMNGWVMRIWGLKDFSHSWGRVPPRRTRRPLPSSLFLWWRSEIWTLLTMPAPCCSLWWSSSARDSSAKTIAGETPVFSCSIFLFKCLSSAPWKDQVWEVTEETSFLALIHWFLFARFAIKLLEDVVFFVADVINSGQPVLDIVMSKANRERQKLMREQNILKQVCLSAPASWVLHTKATVTRSRCNVCSDLWHPEDPL